MPIISLEDINRRVREDADGYIKECESRYKDSIQALSEQICKEKNRVLVMLAGPSSSGKTTTANLLAKDIRKTGRSAVVISLDDFYNDQKLNHTFEDGTVDYETVKALDVEYLCECMHSLMDTGVGMVPRFSFVNRKRESYTQLEIGEDEIVILEGLHALNTAITEPLKDEKMIKIYISVSTRIGDRENVLLTKRDIRFMRRLLRDYRHRNSDVENTYYLWNGVRMGEDRYLFPFRDRADIRIDSLHGYEVNVFKAEVKKLLDGVAPDSIYYNAALLLKEKLERFIEIDADKIPKDSLLTEFSC